MSRTIELPDKLYEALEKAAAASGTTPVGWIVTHLEPSSNPRTLADLFAGRVGRIGSGGKGGLSEAGGEQFTDYLDEKRRGGHL